MESPRPSGSPKGSRTGTEGATMVRQFRERPMSTGNSPSNGSKPSAGSSRLISIAVLAVIAVGGGVYWMNSRNTPPPSQTPSVAGEIDSLKTATTVTSKANFTGTCKEAGKAFAFNVKGEVTSFGNASRALVAQAVTPQDVLTTNNYVPPAAITLDSAWWEVSGAKSGKITLAATANDAKTQAPLTFSCDVELPGA